MVQKGSIEGSMNYIFFHTITHNEKLLIAWVNYHFPNLKFSFSGPGWVTFKIESPQNKSFSLDFECPLALRFGYGLDIIKCPDHHPAPLLEKITELVKIHHCNKVHYFERVELKNEDNSLREKLQSLPIQLNTLLKHNDKCLQIFKIQDGLYATGLTTIYHDNQSPFVGATLTAKVPPESPSRAYLKIAQLDDLYRFDWKANDTVLELGASPGGISTYLLNQGLEVHAIDSAPLKIQHPKLKTIIDSVQRLKSDELSPNTKWIVSDLNLSPKQVIQEVLRLSQNLEELRGIFLTLKLTHVELVPRLGQYVDLLQNHFKNFEFSLMQVPSHRQETHVIGLRRN